MFGNFNLFGLTMIMIFFYSEPSWAFPTQRPLPPRLQNSKWTIYRDHAIRNKFYVVPKGVKLVEQTTSHTTVNENACEIDQRHSELELNIQRIGESRSKLVLNISKKAVEFIELGEKIDANGILIAKLTSQDPVNQKEIDRLNAEIKVWTDRRSSATADREQFQKDLRLIELQLSELVDQAEDLEEPVFRASSILAAQFQLKPIEEVKTEVGFVKDDTVQYVETIALQLFPVGSYASNPQMTLEELATFNQQTKRFSAFWSEAPFDYSATTGAIGSDYKRLNAHKIPGKLYFQRALTLKDYCALRKKDMRSQLLEAYQIGIKVPAWKDTTLNGLNGQAFLEMDFEVTKTAGKFLFENLAKPSSSISDDLGDPQRFGSNLDGHYEWDPVTLNIEW